VDLYIYSPIRLHQGQHFLRFGGCDLCICVQTALSVEGYPVLRLASQLPSSGVMTLGGGFRELLYRFRFRHCIGGEALSEMPSIGWHKKVNLSL
jgi:hypothetical protein